MNEPVVSSAASTQENLTAGQILRKVRQAQGLHIAALATSIKVLPRKLELLEADQYDELLDATFTRALAQAVCRSLKIDPAPVLVLLPKASSMQLEKAQSNLNTPFHERSDRPSRHESKFWGKGLPLQVWLPALLVLGAVVLYVTPEDTQPWRVLSELLPVGSEPAPEVVAVTKAALELQPVSSSAIDAETALAASQALPSEPAPEPTASDPAVASTSTLLELQVNKESWIEVKDSAGTQLLARRVVAQEVVALNGSLPLQLKIGNAANTTVRFRGELIDLLPVTHNNVARLELK